VARLTFLWNIEIIEEKAKKTSTILPHGELVLVGKSMANYFIMSPLFLAVSVEMVYYGASFRDQTLLETLLKLTYLIILWRQISNPNIVGDLAEVKVCSFPNCHQMLQFLTSFNSYA
jgi:hypothetical protein